MSANKKIVIFTGAGISAESGIKTFRDGDGLWEQYRIEEVATPEAWARNPEVVLDFYNQRRRGIANASPNAAHIGLADLQAHFNVQIITQNIDDLHERAGSEKVLHLHGEIFKMRSEHNPALVYEIKKDICIGDLAEDGAQLRPDIVWFGEPVDKMEYAISLAAAADIFVVIGSSLLVYPAASLLHFVPSQVPTYILDKQIPPVGLTNFKAIEKPATQGIFELRQLLLGE